MRRKQKAETPTIALTTSYYIEDFTSCIKPLARYLRNFRCKIKQLASGKSAPFMCFDAALARGALKRAAARQAARLPIRILSAAQNDDALLPAPRRNRLLYRYTPLH